MSTHKTHIKANQAWLRINWRELWEYRDLLFFLVRRDFTAVYKQSVLGPLWFVIQPLATTLVFTVVFGNFGKMSTDGVPPFLFYYCGLFLWNYFQSCMNHVSDTLIANAHMFGKVYFPRLVVPLAIVVSNLAQFLLNLLLFSGFLLYFIFRTDAAIQPSWWILGLPLMVLQCAAIGLGVGLWLSALTAKYRDLRFAIPFLAQLWMFATPVAYSATLATGKWEWMVLLNPMSSVIQFNRMAFLGAGGLDGEHMALGAVLSILLLLSGLLVFNRVQRNFIDTV